MSVQPGGDPTRASDRERDATADRLQSALADGRLDVEEYQTRLDAAMRARTRGELAALTADLPVPVPDPAQRRKELAERDKREWYDEWRSWAGVAVLLTGIWGVTSIAQAELNFFWPIFPLGVWAVVILASVFNRHDDGSGSR